MKLRSNLLRAALFAAALATSTPNYATTFSTNYTDMWGIARNRDGACSSITKPRRSWVPFHLRQGEHGSVVHGRLEPTTIGPNNQPSYTATLFQTSGPALGAPFNPALVQYRPVGQATIEFGDDAHALLTYTIDGAGAVKQVRASRSRRTASSGPTSGRRRT